MLTVLRKFIPIVKNENIVTERTTEGESPAKSANDQSPKMIIINLMKLPDLEFGIGFSRNNKMYIIMPTCNPETAKICTAPAA